MVATFDAAVPDDAKIVVTKGTTEIAGTFAKDEAKTTVTFTGKANLTAGTYTVTATLGESKVSKDVEVKDSYVAEIKILNTEALTGKKDASSKEATAAYIYYDVLNQYGESIRTSENIEWTTAPNNKTVDKAAGKITVTKDDGFTYGSQIYITGVHVKSGMSYTGSVTVGMAQAVDTVDFAGFLSTNDKTKKLESLPEDFAKDTYYLLYKTKDKNGNALDASNSEYTSENLTFISDSPLVMNIDSKVTKVFTVGGEEYAAVLVQPGQYVDKGGEVNITAISNKTGTKSTKNYTVGSAGLLQSIELSAPASVVADGDDKVEIPYVAKDTKGNEIKNYETIVRSTNSLSLTANEGKLWVEEKADGTAAFKWSDDSAYDPKTANTYGKAEVSNEISRKVSLTTVVVGGTSNNFMLEVSDIRRPSAIKHVTLNSDDNNTIAATNESNITITGDNKIVFLDQYGAELDKDKAAAFFNYAKDQKFGKSSDSGYYGIKVDVTDTADNEHLGLGSDKVYYGGDMKIAVKAADLQKVDSDTVKFSIVKSKDNAPGTKINLGTKDAPDERYVETVMSKWDDVSKIDTESYVIVPIDKISDPTIQKIAKQELVTDLSPEDNASSVTSGSALATGVEGFVEDQVTKDNLNIVIKGKYQNSVVTIPNAVYAVDSDSEITTNADVTKVASVTAGALKWKDLYDFNTYSHTRTDAEKTLVLVKKTDSKAKIKSVITFSDAKSTPTTLTWVVGHVANAKAITLQPSMTNIADEAFLVNPHLVDPWWSTHLMVLDQYGKAYSGDKIHDTRHSGWGNCPNKEHGSNGVANVDFTVSNYKENTGAFAHKLNSYSVNANGSAGMNITGAELGDTFTLTATIAGTKISSNVEVTVGNDEAATINSVDGSGKAYEYDSDGVTVKTKGSLDKGLRSLLGYDR